MRDRYHRGLMACAAILMLGACGPATSSDSHPPEPVFSGVSSPTSGAHSGEPTPGAVSSASTETGEAPEHLRSAARRLETDWAWHSVDLQGIESGGVGKDGTPSLDHPPAVSAGDADHTLDDSEPVIAVEINGEARAYPLQVLMWHEIANDVLGGTPIAVTFCPLCNAALVFDRRVDGEAMEFGVSGLLRNSDLVMYDRATESLWQQMEGEAIVGAHTGKTLRVLPSMLLSWSDYRAAYPGGSVIAPLGGRAYGSNPYAGYDTPGRPPFLFSGALDDRLAPTERVLVIDPDRLDDQDAASDGGGAAGVSGPADDSTRVPVAYSYAHLRDAAVVNDIVGGVPVVVRWIPGQASALDAPRIADGRDVGTAVAFGRQLASDATRTLTFEPAGSLLRDVETDSTWNIAGVAVDGPLTGDRLTPIVHATYFWFAWAAFRPDTDLRADA